VSFLASGAATIRALGDEFPVASPSSATPPRALIIDRPDVTVRLIDAHRRRWPDAAIIVLDHYGPARSADVLVNLNAARQRRAKRSGGPLTLTGLGFAILRESFRGKRRDVARMHGRLGLCFGGTDSRGWTAATVSALAPVLRAEGWRATVVVGRSAAAVVRVSRKNADVIRLEVQPRNPAAIFAECDLLVIGGGTLLMEAACLGVPAVVAPRTEAERVFATEFVRGGAAVVVAGESRFSPASVVPRVTRLMKSDSGRAAMSRAGRHLVDGKGSQRVVAAVLSAMSRK
jgi:spore coat polysaccharide biosynthesis predicted glycosyltransferase SpsG